MDANFFYVSFYTDNIWEVEIGLQHHVYYTRVSDRISAQSTREDSSDSGDIIPSAARAIQTSLILSYLIAFGGLRTSVPFEASWRRSCPARWPACCNVLGAPTRKRCWGATRREYRRMCFCAGLPTLNTCQKGRRIWWHCRPRCLPLHENPSLYVQ